MSEQKAWLSRALAADILGDITQVRTYVAALARAMTADELRPERSALVTVVGRLDDLVVSVRSRLDIPSVLHEPVQELPEVREVGLNTAGRRLQGNGARHRAKP